MYTQNRREAKKLIPVEDGTCAWLDRVIREFPANGLTRVVTTKGVEQAKEWIEGFYQVTEKSVRAAT